MSEENRKVIVLACSGIGKVYGLIAREAVLKVARELRPDAARTMCLALLMTDDAEAHEIINGATCITVDGCPKLCAAKNGALAGGVVAEQVRVVDLFRAYRGVNAGTATALTADGWKIVADLAGQLAEKIDALRAAGTLEEAE